MIATTNLRLRPGQFQPGDTFASDELTSLAGRTVTGITFVRGGIRVGIVDTSGFHTDRVLNGRYKFGIVRPGAPDDRQRVRTVE